MLLIFLVCSPVTKKNPMTIEKVKSSDLQNFTKMSMDNQVYNKGSLENLSRNIEPEAMLADDAEELLQEIARSFVCTVTKEAIQESKINGEEKITVSDIHAILSTKYDLLLPGDIESMDLEDSHTPAPSDDYQEKLKAVRKFMAQRGDE